MNKLLFLFISVFLISLSACVDKDFDEPPKDGVDPDIEPTNTIAELLEMYPPNFFQTIDEDIILEVIVSADDESGQFFRSLVVQDASGGISLQIDATELYNEYGVGRRLFIMCNGLTVGNYNGLPQLGGGFEFDGSGQIDGIIGIPEPLLPDFIAKGQWNQPVVAKKITTSQLSAADLNTLVELENSQFFQSEVGEPFAIDTLLDNGERVRIGVNRGLGNCDGEPSILVRTSGYAVYAKDPVPGERGSVRGIYGVFGSDKQLTARDLNDFADMTEDRCDVSTNIKGIRALYAGQPTEIPTGAIITAKVISDRSANNINNQNMVIQDESGAGIVVRFLSQHSFNLNDIITLDASGQTLDDFRGLLQIDDVDNSRASKTSGSVNIGTRVATVQELLDNHKTWESTLVEIKDASLSGNPTYAGDVSVSDGTAAINMFTFNSAEFANDAVPGDPVDLVSILSTYDDAPQLNMRNGSDVEGGGNGGDPIEVDIQVIRDLYNGTTTSIPENYVIKGIVISDLENGNIHGLNMIFQDNTAGITVRFSDDHSFRLGDEVELNIKGQELSEFHELLQINNVPPANGKVVATGQSVTPRAVTVKEIEDNLEAWESTLVVISDVTITGSSTYSGYTDVTDASGVVEMFTRSQASFANNSIPGGNVQLTCIVGTFDGTQVYMRNGNDAQ